MGTTLREVIFGIGGGIKDGKKFKAVQTGGPSGGCLTEKHLDLPIDYDNLLAAGSMMGSGGMDCDGRRRLYGRYGQILSGFHGRGVMWQMCSLPDWPTNGCTRCCKRLRPATERSRIWNGFVTWLVCIKDTALCGLGQTSPNPVLSTMDNFYDEYLAHVKEKRCPSHQCRD